MIKKMIYFLGSLVAVLSSWIYLKKKKQAEKLEKVSSKKKKQQIRPDRLSSSKQKDSVQKAIQKNAKTLERRLQKIGETTKPQQMKQIRFPVPKSLALHNRYPIMGQNIQ